MIDISTDRALEQRARSFCEQFANAPAERRFVLGRGEYAASIAAVMPIGAFVDDFTTDTTFQGVPVIPTSALPAGALVVVASMLRPRSAMATLAGTETVALDYFAYERFCDLHVKPVTFWPQFRAEFEHHRERFEAIRARLADDESVETFDGLVRFRFTGDLAAMAGRRYDLVNQYFEDFLDLRPTGESFVDIGCYDGFTSLEFARRAPGFEHITAFEPAADNYALVVENLAPLGADRVTVHECGLSDVPGTLSFSSGHGSASRVTADGDTTIRVERLDDVAITAATFLKMDIEGAEEPALLGGLETIRRFRPRLAISAYHRAHDLWRIPEIVGRSGVDYEIRLRHYTEGIDETVLFFLPTDPSR